MTSRPADRPVPPRSTAHPDASEVIRGFRDLAERAGEVPRPGWGATRARLDHLRVLAVRSLPLARLAEGHLDALAILDEAGRDAPPGALLGVWAAEPAGRFVEFHRQADGWRLRGSKPFASGAGVLTHALVTGRAGSDRMLALVDLAAGGVTVVPGFWRGLGMRDALTGEVVFDLAVDDAAMVGPPGFYLGRPGFWHGAVGVAACWAGGMQALRAVMARQIVGAPSPHGLAHLGQVDALVWTAMALLDGAARAIDADPGDRGGDAARLALRVRNSVAAAGHEVLTRCTKALGAVPLATDDDLPQRMADLQVYLAQHHAEHDAEALGRMTIGTAP